MNGMKVGSLSVDLLREGAYVVMRRTIENAGPQKMPHVEVHIHTPIETSGPHSGDLNRASIEAAKKALHEALEALSNHQP